MFASALATHLVGRVDGVKIRVSHCETCDEDLDNVRTNIAQNLVSEWSKEITFGHVIVEFSYEGNSYLVDATGVHENKGKDPAFEWPLYYGSLTIAEATELAQQDDGWNWRIFRITLEDSRQWSVSIV